MRLTHMRDGLIKAASVALFIYSETSGRTLGGNVGVGLSPRNTIGEYDIISHIQ